MPAIAIKFPYLWDITLDVQGSDHRPPVFLPDTRHSKSADSLSSLSVSSGSNSRQSMRGQEVFLQNDAAVHSEFFAAFAAVLEVEAFDEWFRLVERLVFE